MWCRPDSPLADINPKAPHTFCANVNGRQTIDVIDRERRERPIIWPFLSFCVCLCICVYYTTPDGAVPFLLSFLWTKEVRGDDKCNRWHVKRAAPPLWENPIL